MRTSFRTTSREVVPADGSSAAEMAAAEAVHQLTERLETGVLVVRVDGAERYAWVANPREGVHARQAGEVLAAGHVLDSQRSDLLPAIRGHCDYGQ